MYLFIEKVSDDRARVATIVYDTTDLTAEDKKLGFEVDVIPEPVAATGKRAELYTNPITRELWYELVDHEEKPDEKITRLEAENANMKNQITTIQETINFLLGI